MQIQGVFLGQMLHMLHQCKKPHFPRIGSDDLPPPPPLGVENVKIRENSEKIRGQSRTLFRPLKTVAKMTIIL